MISWISTSRFVRTLILREENKRRSNQVDIQAIQLSMDELMEDNKFVMLPVTDDAIGGMLLPLVTQGQYTDPLHAIREYVQNAYDADASQVIVRIAGNSLIISDDGRGMGHADLLEARGLGVSSKDPELDVGFRGI